MDEATRFWAKVQHSDGCWEWQAATSAGYGRFGVGKKMMLAHRISYEMLVGPILDGLHIDHLCRNRLCVNPDHLQAVTHRENVLRGEAGMIQRMRTECPYGHPYDEINTHWYQGRRYCRACAECRRVRH